MKTKIFAYSSIICGGSQQLRRHSRSSAASFWLYGRPDTISVVVVGFVCNLSASILRRLISVVVCQRLKEGDPRIYLIILQRAKPVGVANSGCGGFETACWKSRRSHYQERFSPVHGSPGLLLYELESIGSRAAKRKRRLMAVCERYIQRRADPAQIELKHQRRLLEGVGSYCLRPEIRSLRMDTLHKHIRITKYIRELKMLRWEVSLQWLPWMNPLDYVRPATDRRTLFYDL